MHQEQQLESRLKNLEGIVTGDGREMGIGPLTLQHESQLNGDHGLEKRVRKLEDNSIRTAAFVAAAVFAVEVLVRIWDKVKL